MSIRPIVFIAVATSLAGCNDQYGGRMSISGKVTYKGQTVGDGIVDFEPMDGQGSKSGAQIQKDGSYTIPRDKGLTPGKYRVSVYIGDGYDSSGEGGTDKAKKLAGAGKQGIERAPAEFNKNSTLVREVTSDGPNKFDFDIP
jgi:hypothetical protein